MSDEQRTVVARLPWIELSAASDRFEWWSLEIGGVFVYVTDRHEENGWRIAGRSGIINHDLNAGDPYESREAAMEAGARVAQVTAANRVDRLMRDLADAQRALRDVVVTVG